MKTAEEVAKRFLREDSPRFAAAVFHIRRSQQELVEGILQIWDFSQNGDPKEVRAYLDECRAAITRGPENL